MHTGSTLEALSRQRRGKSGKWGAAPLWLGEGFWDKRERPNTTVQKCPCGSIVRVSHRPLLKEPRGREEGREPFLWVAGSREITEMDWQQVPGPGGLNNIPVNEENPPPKGGGEPNTAYPKASIAGKHRKKIKLNVTRPL